MTGGSVCLKRRAAALAQHDATKKTLFSSSDSDDNENNLRTTLATPKTL